MMSTKRAQCSYSWEKIVMDIEISICPSGSKPENRKTMTTSKNHLLPRHWVYLCFTESRPMAQPERGRDHAVVLVNRSSFPDADGWNLGQNWYSFSREGLYLTSQFSSSENAFIDNRLNYKDGCVKGFLETWLLQTPCRLYLIESTDVSAWALSDITNYGMCIPICWWVRVNGE